MLAVIGATFVIGVSQAFAGPLSTTDLALNDGFGPDGGRWRGSVSISREVFGNELEAEVDWAAFAPGKFQLYLNAEGIAQVDPSGPNEVAYVYQITSVTEAIPGVDTLTVSIDPTDGRGTVSAPTFVLTGAATEKSPSSGGDNNDTMAWFFEGSELQIGDTSSLLVFTSPFAPELAFMQVNSGLAGPLVSPLVASPSDRIFTSEIPEPSTIALLFACVAAGLLRKCSRR